MKIYLYILIFAFLSSSCGQKEPKKKPENRQLESLKYGFKSATEYTPLSFIKAAQNRNPLNLFETQNDFPKDWVKIVDIDSLVSIIDSKEKCNCYFNPFSSYIPNDSAQVGGFAIEFIKAFKENKKVNLGLYSCPKLNEKEAEELKVWWENQKKE
ncbi:MAG: hypothetical protein M0D53_01920 [Flavobacterium sp. JAD_PAG50586_2]|nr:MAG: hypothetical protein M0D53_08890 [Flavobacterium sp. JAD_PAG50586_2]UPT71193.1 MAG: hypothetical protein M0D53_01920 [Flavobacterium sp. JAD_PAG50586_2]